MLDHQIKDDRETRSNIIKPLMYLNGMILPALVYQQLMLQYGQLNYSIIR